MKWNPWLRAKRDTFEEFLAGYDREVAMSYEDSRGGSALMGAMANRDPSNRVAIANLLLDDGADPSFVAPGDKVNVLHLIFDGFAEEHDFEREAVLLQRLLEGGADINQRSPRFSVPLECLASMPCSDSELAPFYEVVFSWPHIDMGAVINKQGSTIREFLFELGRPDLPRLAREYDAAHPSS